MNMISTHTHIPTFNNPDLKHQGFIPDPPTPQHCSSPEKYAQAIGFHFADNHSALLKHLDGVTDRTHKSAVYNHNEKLRDFLGIRNPEGFRKKFLQFKQPEQIATQAAPAALAEAALHLGKGTRIHRALNRMRDLIHEHPLKGTSDAAAFQKSVETGFNKLLGDLDKLKDREQGKVVSMITWYGPQRLDGAALERVARAAKRASENPGVAVQQRMILANFAKEYLPAVGGERGRFAATFLKSNLAVPPKVPPRVSKLNIPAYDATATPFNGKTGLQLVGELRNSGWTDKNLEDLKKSIVECTSRFPDRKAITHDAAATIGVFNSETYAGLCEYLGASMSRNNTARFEQLAAAIHHESTLTKGAASAA